MKDEVLKYWEAKKGGRLFNNDTQKWQMRVVVSMSIKNCKENLVWLWFFCSEKFPKTSPAAINAPIH